MFFLGPKTLLEQFIEESEEERDGLRSFDGALHQIGKCYGFKSRRTVLKSCRRKVGGGRRENGQNNGKVSENVGKSRFTFTSFGGKV